MYNKKNDICLQIEEMREELNNSVENNYNKKIVLEISQKLDELLNIYYKLLE